MPLPHLDILLRISAVTVMLLLAALLLRQHRQLGKPAWLFAPLALCLSGFVAGNTPDAGLRLPGLAGSAAHGLSGFAVIFLWWFCLACFDRGFRVRGPVLAVGVAWALVACVDRGMLGDWGTGLGLSRLLVAMGFGIVLHLVWRLHAERGGDLIQRRHEARLVVALLLGGQLLADLTADLLFGFDWRPLPFAMAQNAAILGFGLWLATILLTVRADALTFGGGADPAETAVGPGVADGTGAEAAGQDDALRRRLSVLIGQERVYLDPELSFAGFVEKMGAPERTVRRLVNQELGFDHFRGFLNHYRLAEARRRLADPGCAGDKLIAVALDSGFASLASFNRVFRAAQGCTPSQYRDAAAGPKQ